MSKSNAAKIIGHTITGASNIFRLINPELLSVDPENDRNYDDPNEGLDALYQSIKAEGLKTPLQVYDDGMAHDGNRRLTVINRLIAEGEKLHGPATDNGEVRVLIVPRPENSQEKAIARLNTNEARQFSSMAQARMFSDLRNEGLSASDISKRTPFTAMHIGNMLTLADASEAIHNIVKGGHMSATLAVETLRKFGENVVIRSVALALTDGKDRATQRHVDFIVAEDERVIAEQKAKDAPAGSAAEGVIEGSAASTSGGTDQAEGVTEGSAASTSGDTSAPKTESAKTKTKDQENQDKFTTEVGKELFLNFLPHAKRYLDNDLSPDDFKVELGLLVKELEIYGIKIS